MTPEIIGVIGIFLLLVLFLIKIPVAIGLLLVGFAGYSAIRGIDIGLVQLGSAPFETASSYSLSVIPLFILMGMLLSYSGLGQDMFRSVDSWIGHISGGLDATIGTSAIFSSISGSVNATTATVAKITLPEMEKYKYKPSLSTASLAARRRWCIDSPKCVAHIIRCVDWGSNWSAIDCRYRTRYFTSGNLWAYHLHSGKTRS